MMAMLHATAGDSCSTSRRWLAPMIDGGRMVRLANHPTTDDQPLTAAHHHPTQGTMRGHRPARLTALLPAIILAAATGVSAQWFKYPTPGVPRTAAGAATLTERIRRPNFGTLQVDFTVNDPKAYTRPWSVRLEQTFVADEDLIDEICLEGVKPLHVAPR
jgi:hypothetical protein